MNVKLISITRSMIGEVQEASTAEPLIVYIARVSNPSNQANMLTGTKLISYLIENRHWSPFEMVHMTVEIKTSRAIAQQILRHRSFSFQEFSQRYAVATENEIYPARRQDVKNRQNSIDDMDDATKFWFDAAQGAVDKVSSEYYKEALAKGIAKEQARFLLPLSTSTTLYMSGSVRSWIHYIQLRADVATQLEHREIAEGVKAIFAEQFPATSEALGWK
jgi:thymidylate synthase (FAD)